jgi:nicotinamidase-related amidase
MMSVSSTDKGLLTPDNTAFALVDYQASMLGHVAEGEQAGVVDKAAVMATTAAIFGVPAVVTAVEAPGYDGKIVAPVIRSLPNGCRVLKRTSLNAWDYEPFVSAIRETARRNLVVAGLWSDVCVLMLALQALTDGYGVYAVIDASAGTTPQAHDAALRRMEQAGGVSLTAVQLLLELQRDCARTDHYNEVMTIVADARRDSVPRAGLGRQPGSKTRRSTETQGGS